MKHIRYCLTVFLIVYFPIMSFAQSYYRVTVQKANVRNKPESSALVVGVLNHDEIISVSDINKGWAAFTYKGKIRFVNVSDLEPTDSSQLDNNTTEVKPSLIDKITKHSEKNKSENGKDIVDESSIFDPFDYNFFGICYRAPFKEADMGHYGLIGHVFSSSGFGFSLNIGTNMGIVDIKSAGVSFSIGPNYGYVISEPCFVYLPLCFNYIYAGKDNKDWGFSLLPSLGLKLKKLVLSGGLDIGWSHSTKKIAIGFSVQLGFNL